MKTGLSKKIIEEAIKERIAEKEAFAYDAIINLKSIINYHN